MLFLLKRTVPTSLAALVVLAAAGLSLRRLIGRYDPWPLPSLRFDWLLLLWGVGVCALALCSDALIHGGLSLAFGGRYLARCRELAAVFRGQSFAAMLTGAAMAGLGEELVFRGLSIDPEALAVLAVAFGLLHHVRRLWPFTVWSVWEGVLFAAVLWWTRELAVTMTAHFLHDLLGFLIFRRSLRSPAPPAAR
jgi:membrane protease YdiL (CAAX protease family)